LDAASKVAVSARAAAPDASHTTIPPSSSIGQAVSAGCESCPEQDHLRETAQAIGSVPSRAEAALYE
jgi:hypothetical protein